MSPEKPWSIETWPKLDKSLIKEINPIAISYLEWLATHTKLQTQWYEENWYADSLEEIISLQNEISQEAWIETKIFSMPCSWEDTTQIYYLYSKKI